MDLARATSDIGPTVRVLIDDDTGDGDALWARVDAALAEGAEVWLRSPLLRRLTEALGREHDGRSWLVLAPPAGAGGPPPGRLVRARDLVLSGLALLALAPPLAVVALLVKLSSPGPVFFADTVVGRGRSRFVWRKFRSMRVVPPDEDLRQRRAGYQAFVEGRHPVASTRAPGKVIDQRRVTGVGGLLRRYSVDELPQLWNVLRGDMSLVGPRPCSPHEAEFYRGWRERRFDVPPGLTGVWQVFGRGRVGFDEGAAMDVYYRYRRSFGFDLYLISRTVAAVLTGAGAL